VVAHPQGEDLAILKFAADGVACLNLGHSTDAVEGQTVLVIGSPEGLQGTVSEGIISAFRENRSTPVKFDNNRLFLGHVKSQVRFLICLF